jgi:hypothetical protein
MRLLTTTNANKFLGFAGGNNNYAGTKLTLLNVTNETAPTTYGTDSLSTVGEYTSNANGTGDVAFKMNTDGTYTVFFLSTNNGLGATKSDANILPISLARFSAGLNNKNVRLSWSTVSELNSNYFEIEKSINGKDFSSIGRVKTKAVNGSSTQQLEYTFEDSRPGTGKVYYRLKQVDLDGKYSISTVSVVSVPMIKGFTVSNLGNPVRNSINLLVNAVSQRVLTVQLIGANGAISFSKQFPVQAGSTTINIPVDNLTTGSINVVVKDNQDQQVLRLVKQ